MNTITSPVEIIRESLKIFFDKKNFTFFLRVYLFLLPFSIITYIENSQLNPQLNRINSENAVSFFSQNLWLMGIYLLVGIIYLIVSFWVSAAGIVAVGGIIRNEILSVKDVYARAKKSLLPYSLLLLVLGVITVLGFVLLIIPGIIFMVWYSFAAFELITNGRGLRESLTESKKLVSGRFAKIFGRLIVFGLFTLLVQIIFSLIPYGFGSVISPLFGGLLVLPYFLLYNELSKK